MSIRKLKSVKGYEYGSRNVYRDLGYADAHDTLIKAQLVGKIANVVAERGYTQTRAAALLQLTQPKLSKMLRGQFRGFSERKLMDCLARLGQDVQIVVRPLKNPKKMGSVSVVFV